MNILSRLNAMAQLGKGELRGAYLERKKEIKARADFRRQQTKSRILASKIKADEAKEMAELESAMYQAQINAQNAQKKAKTLRHQAGHFTAGERVGIFSKDAYKVGRSFVGGFVEGSGKRRTTTRRKRK
jgi:uncharacterized protein YlxW (UPF0749 family)